MKNIYLKSKRFITRAAIVFSSLLIFSQLVIAIVAPIQTSAAAPDSITIYKSTMVGRGEIIIDSTECKFVIRKSVKTSGLNDDVNYMAPTGTGTSNTPIAVDADKNPSLKDDIGNVENLISSSNSYYYIYLVPVSPGTGTKNTNICTMDSRSLIGGGGHLFLRPSDPTKLFGSLKTNTNGTDRYYGIGANAPGGTSYYANLDPSSSTVTLGNYQFRTQSYKLEDPDNLLKDLPAPVAPGPGSGTGGGAGYCAGVDGYAREDCMKANVIDFKTIIFRGETYTLDSWEGQGEGNDYLTYYLSFTTVDYRKPLADATRPSNIKPVIWVKVNDNDLDLNVDGDATKEEKQQFFDTLNSLSSKTTPTNALLKDFNLAGRIDLSGNPITGTPNAISTLDDLPLNGVINFRKMFTYYTNGNTVAYKLGSAGDNETQLITGNFTSNGDQLRYETGVASTVCPGTEKIPRIEFTEDPSKASSSQLNAEWTMIIDLADCTTATGDVIVEIDSTGTTAPPPPASGVIDGGDPTIKSCEDNFPTFGLIVCEALGFFDSLLGGLESAIQNTLEISPDKFSVDGDSNSLYFAWVNMARFSSVLLAIVSLVMVIGTALGDYKLFNAYTVKKVLPRLVIAAVGIWLSWSIVTAYINAINTIGKGLADLLWSPFYETTGKAFSEWGLADVFATEPSGTKTELGYAGLTIIGGLVAGGLAGYALITGAAWALLSGLVPVAVFILIGYVVLVLRQSIIVFLLAVAPIAIVSWVLPNTQKLVWGKWSKFLNQLLFMYPLFMGVLAAGKIFSYIISQNNGSGIFQRFIPVIAYVTPYVLLPAIFKSSGGALSKLTASGLKFGDRASKGAKQAAADRKAMSSGALAKNQRKQIRTQQAQARFAKGMRDSSFKRTLAGGLMGKEARTSMLASAIGADKANRRKDIENATSVLEEKGPFSYEEKDKILELAKNKNATSAERIAAMNRLSEFGDTKGLMEAQAALAKEGGDGEKIWRDFQRGNDKLRTFAPHLATDSMQPKFEVFEKASAEKASAWSKETWEAYYNNPGSASQAKLLAQQVANSEQLWRAQGKGTRDYFASIGVSPGITGTPIVPPPGGPGATFSDIRLKKNITYLKTINGHRIYKYQYIWSETYYAGVMAQEINTVKPEAVNKDSNGYLYVNYTMLDLAFLTYEEWQKIHKDKR